MYSDIEILSALYETLHIARVDLNKLLTVDHPCSDYLDKIYEENKIIADITSLIRDYETKLIAQILVSLSS